MRTALAVLAFLTLAACAEAQELFIWFYGSGGGDFMDSPPTFTGGMDVGGDITAGSWTVSVRDDGWPTDPSARQAYIWQTFFADNYTLGEQPYWTGYFDLDHGLMELNRIVIIDETNGGTLSGLCTFEYQVEDTNGNGELDEGEFCEGALASFAVLLRPWEGEGHWEYWGGTGNYFGTYNRDCPETHDTWWFGMYLWLIEGW